MVNTIDMALTSMHRIFRFLWGSVDKGNRNVSSFRSVKLFQIQTIQVRIIFKRVRHICQLISKNPSNEMPLYKWTEIIKYGLRKLLCIVMIFDCEFHSVSLDSLCILLDWSHSQSTAPYIKQICHGYGVSRIAKIQVTNKEVLCLRYRYVITNT